VIDEATPCALEDCPMIISLTSKSSFVEIERRFVFVSNP